MKKHHITKRPASVEEIEAIARAKYLLARAINGSDYVVTDALLYPVRSSAELRAAADVALVVELTASIEEDEEC